MSFSSPSPPGQLLIALEGRRRYPGVEPGAIITAEGIVGEKAGRSINPVIEILRPAGPAVEDQEQRPAGGEQLVKSCTCSPQAFILAPDLSKRS